MDIVDALASDVGVAELKHTPAYASFDANMDKLTHLLGFIFRGVENFSHELKSSIKPKFAELCAEIATLGRNPETKQIDEVTDNEAQANSSAETKRRGAELSRQLSNVALEPLEEFASGFSTLRQWIPVILVTTVEAYLKDVRMFEAKVNPAIMQSSEQAVTYGEVLRARSTEDLAEEMQSRWAMNFVDDGGPTRWIDRLTRMGARTYDSQTAKTMEILWGVRHVIVHSAGLVTLDFVRRHPEFGATVGKDIVITLDQIKKWSGVAHHFVDVTDLYFAQRYKSELSAK